MRLFGLDEFKNALKILQKFDIEDRLLHAAELMQYRARDLVPVEAGRLRDSIKLDKVDELKMIVSADAPYSGFVEFGTRPHVIRPKVRRALRFEVDGKVVFATRVYHPGTSPHPFFEPAFDYVVERLPKIFNLFEVIK